MAKSKKKRVQTQPRPENAPVEPVESASEDPVTDALPESGDDASASSAAGAPSPQPDETAQPYTQPQSTDSSGEAPYAHSRRERRKAEKSAQLNRTRAFRLRTPDLSPRQAARQARIQRQAARRMGTPHQGHTGISARRQPLRVTLSVLFSVLAIGLTTGYFAFDVRHWQALDVRKITAAARTGLMFDNRGERITTIRGSQNRVVIPLEDIPVPVRQAFLAAEDLRFYHHHGVDAVRLAGALAVNLREGSYAQGGSTITMQLIRQSHLSTQKTIARKLEEVWLALQLEQRFSKDEILAMYLNYIYFGNGAYGIQAASQLYFGVDAKELSLAQAASLAASIKAPSYYAPASGESPNRSRSAYILSTMLAEGMISADEYDSASAQEIAVVQRAPEVLEHGWFVDAVLDEAERLLNLTADQVLTGGYLIETTMSREHQQLLEKQFTRDLFPANASDGTKVQGAAACVNTRTGEVMAIVGGRSYDVRRGFNRATRLRRQPGSSLKPLAVYAPAIDQYGYTTASVLKDEPTSFGGYKPRNSGYTYYGNVSIRSALASSLNVAAVSLLDKIGVDAARAYLQKVGIPLDARDANLALALGSMTYGVSPVELAAAYAPFGNGGLYHSPHFISRITDSSGCVLYQHSADGQRVLKPTTAYLMTSLLQSVTSYGTGAKLSGAGTPVAGKTGTVNMTGGGNRDIWMAAYNPEISCAFWMGFDETDQKHRLQGWVSGGDNTAAMARDYFKALYQNRDKPQFQRPEGIISLEIDKQSIKWRGEAMLAVDLTPKSDRYTEYFTTDNHPTKKSDIWTPPRALNRFTITHSDAGYPLLAMQPADTAVYRVQRDTYGESFVLTELYGGQGETLYYTDTSAKPGVVYTYRVTPVHAELLNNGILLEGVQSVQVAQARQPATGLLDRVRSWLTGLSDREEPNVAGMTENQSSIFWTGN